MLARRNVGLRQPRGGQVAAAEPVVVADVARDVAQLECDAEVAGALQRRTVPGVDAHDDRHHYADDAGDVVAIIERVLEAAIDAVPRVHREAVEQL